MRIDGRRTDASSPGTGPAPARTRQAILNAAARLVAEEGIAALSMTAVADRAYVSRVTVHRHFPTKRELARALEEEVNQAPGVREGSAGDRKGSTTVAQADGRRRLLRSAQELFSQKGFAATSLREIAERAQISQPMIYRYFESKEALFQEAAIEPLNEFIDASLQPSKQTPGAAVIDYGREFCGSLYDVLNFDRDLLLTLVATHRAEDSAGSTTDPLARVFQHFFDLMGEFFISRSGGISNVDRSLVCRLSFGMVLAAVLHGGWLLTEDVSREHLVEEMAQLLTYGIHRT